jgi:hypothetical protein
MSPVQGQIYEQFYYPELTTPRHENRKILHEIKILKANKHAPHVNKLQIYRMTPKNIPQKLVRISL